MTKYHMIEQTIKTGDGLFGSGAWPMSRLIQWYTGHEISHVGIACWVAFNGNPPILCMFEAMEGRDVRIIPLEKVLRTTYWPSGGKLYHKKLLEPYNGKELMEYCTEHWLDAYAGTYQFILGISPRLRKIRSMLGKSLDTDENRMHCSELIADGLQEQEHEFNKDTALITPGELFDCSCFSPNAIELERSSRKQIQAVREAIQGRGHNPSGHTS